MAERRGHRRTGHAATTRQITDFTTAATASVTVDEGAGSTNNQRMSSAAKMGSMTVGDIVMAALLP